MNSPNSEEIKVAGLRIQLNEPPGFVTVTRGGWFGRKEPQIIPLGDPEEGYTSIYASGPVCDFGGWAIVSETRPGRRATMSGYEILSEEADEHGCRDIVEAIQRFLVKNAGIERLASRKDIDGLLEATEHKYRTVREAAAKKLIEFGDARGAEYLIRYIREPIEPSCYGIYSGGTYKLSALIALQSTKLEILSRSVEYWEALWRASQPQSAQISAGSLTINCAFEENDIVEHYRHFTVAGFQTGPEKKMLGTTWKVLRIWEDGVAALLVSGVYAEQKIDLEHFQYPEAVFPGHVQVLRSTPGYVQANPSAREYDQPCAEFRRVANLATSHSWHL